LLLPELGVETASAVDLWAGILNGVTSFIAAFASPVWGRVADPAMAGRVANGNALNAVIGPPSPPGHAAAALALNKPDQLHPGNLGCGAFLPVAVACNERLLRVESRSSN